MSKIAINALSLRKGGGLQVLIGLLSRFSERHHYVVLCADQSSLALLRKNVGDPDHIEYLDPVGNASAISAFLWGMLKQKEWLKQNEIKCVFGVNHHFPSGVLPQVIYHLNVLRFERPIRKLWVKGEVSDRLRDWRARRALVRADANMFESHFLLETAQKIENNIQLPSVVYIGLQDKLEMPATENKSGELPGDDILVVTSSAPHKDNETLVRMLSVLLNDRPDRNWTLNIAGNPSEELQADFLVLAKQLGVAQNISFLGFMGHEELAEKGRSALCLVSTSLVESFCMVALEAMSWGCPVIVCNCSSMPESVGDAGLLAEPKNPKDFASKVLQIADDVVFRKKLVAQGLVRSSQMTWSSAAEQTEKIFDLAMEN